MGGGAGYSRLKNWIAEGFNFADINAEFDQILDKLEPQFIGDYSDDVTEMQQQTSPGALSSESQATSLAGELERIRYVISRMIKSDLSKYWYEAPDSDLSLSSVDTPEMKIYLPFFGIGSSSDGQNQAFAEILGRGVIANAKQWTTADIQDEDFDSTNTKFGTFGFKTGQHADASDRILAVNGRHIFPYVGSAGLWFRNLGANDYLAWNPVLGVALYLDSNGYLTAEVTEKTASGDSAKNSSTVAGSTSRAGNSSFQLATMKWRLNDLAGASSDLLELELDGTEEGSQLASQDLDISADDQGVWFFGVRPNDPTWDHFYAAAGLPTAHGDGIWSKTSTGSPTESVSNGVLTVETASSENLYYESSSLVDLSQMTVEWKMKIDSSAGTSHNGAYISILDNSMSRQIIVRIGPTTIHIDDYNQILATVKNDGTKWNVYRLTTSGGTDPVATLYVNGVAIWSGDIDSSASGSDHIRFGHVSTSVVCKTKWEYVKIYDAGDTAPVVRTNNSGQLDDIFVCDEVITDGQISSLVTLSARSVLRDGGKQGLWLPAGGSCIANALNSTGAFVVVNDTDGLPFFSDGRTPLTFRSRMHVTISAATEVHNSITYSDESGNSLQNSDAEAIEEGDTASEQFEIVTDDRMLLPLGLWKILIGHKNSASATCTYAPRRSSITIGKQ